MESSMELGLVRDHFSKWSRTPNSYTTKNLKTNVWKIKKN